MLTHSEKLKHFGIHLGSWLLSTSLAFGCGSAIYFLCQHEQQVPAFTHDYALKQGRPDPGPRGPQTSRPLCPTGRKKNQNKKSFRQGKCDFCEIVAHGDWLWTPLLTSYLARFASLD